MSFTAQELNKQVQLLRLEEVVDPDTGYRTEEWVSFAETFAKVEPLVGREYFAAAAVQEENNAKFTMRFRDDLLPYHRIFHDGGTWNITSIMNIKSRNRETLVLAKRSN